MHTDTSLAFLYIDCLILYGWQLIVRSGSLGTQDDIAGQKKPVPIPQFMFQSQSEERACVNDFLVQEEKGLMVS